MFLGYDCIDTTQSFGCNNPQAYKPKDTAINDTEYDTSSYHVFRSELRILPAEASDQEQKSPANNPSMPSTAPKP